MRASGMRGSGRRAACSKRAGRGARDLEAGLAGQHLDLADLVAGHVAAPAEERQEPLRIGLALAADAGCGTRPPRRAGRARAGVAARRGGRLARGAGGLGELLRRGQPRPLAPDERDGDGERVVRGEEAPRRLAVLVARVGRQRRDVARRAAPRRGRGSPRGRGPATTSPRSALSRSIRSSLNRSAGAARSSASPLLPGAAGAAAAVLQRLRVARAGRRGARARCRAGRGRARRRRSRRARAPARRGAP